MVIYPNSAKTNDMSTQLVIKITATSNWQRLSPVAVKPPTSGSGYKATYTVVRSR